jgi:hypothetical protein
MKNGMKLGLAVCGMALSLLILDALALPGTHVKIPVTPARPTDVATMEEIVKADYESVSGAVGIPRQWGRMLSLYDPNAKVFVVRKAANSELTLWAPTLQEYADEFDVRFVQEGHGEHEVAHKIFRFGNVATVFSSYEGRSSSTGQMTSRGVRTFQLYYDGNRWWISSVSWDAEHPITVIPEELLPRT